MDELRRLFERAIAECDQGESTVDFEGSFVALLDHIKQHREIRGQTEALFLEALSASPTPWELISFCMHELRWQAVQDRAEALRAEANDPRAKRVFDLILEAFREDWDQRDMYSYVFTKRTRSDRREHYRES